MTIYNKILSNKTSIITGSNRGIGKSVTEKLAYHGSNLISCTRKKNKNHTLFLESLKRKFNIEFQEFFFDLSEENQIKNFGGKFAKTYDKVDILINNAAIIDTSLFQMTTLGKLKEIFNVNFFHQILLTQIVVKKMIKNKGGSIVNVSSSAAIQCNPGRLAYSSSKASVIASTKTLSKELARYKIRCNCICPGLAETEMMKSSTDTSFLENIKMFNSQGRVSSPEEIANAIIFLASDQSSYITGEVLNVDGGIL